MNALIAENPTSPNLDIAHEIELARTVSRLPTAAALLPYGLSLASLLRP